MKLFLVSLIVGGIKNINITLLAGSEVEARAESDQPSNSLQPRPSQGSPVSEDDLEDHQLNFTKAFRSGKITFLLDHLQCHR